MDFHSAQSEQEQQYQQQDDDYETGPRPSTTSEQSRGRSRGTSSGGQTSGDIRTQSRGGSVHSTHSHRSPSPGNFMYSHKQPSSKALHRRPGSDGEGMDFGVNTEDWGANDFFGGQGDFPPIAEEATGDNHTRSFNLA